MSDTLNLALTITAADMFSGVLHRFRERITGTGAAAKRVQKDYDLMTESISRGVKAMATARYIAAKMRPGVRAASDLQASMLNVRQLLWSSGEGAAALAKKMALVRRTAVQVSADLPFSATDLANIEANLLQGGVRLQAVVGRHGAAFATAALSAVGKMSPEAVSESLAKVGHAFQLHGGQYGQGADSLARISSSSAATLQELLYNLRQAGPSAHALNIPLKDTATALAAVSTLGEEAGSNLKQFFIGLAGASRRGRRARRQLGVKFFDKKGSFVGLDEAIKRLRAGLAKVHSQQKRMIILQRVFQVQGAQAARLLIQEGNKSYEDIKRKSAAAAGLTQRMSIWGKGLNAAMAKIEGTTQTTLATLFDPMLKPLREAVDKTNELVSGIGRLANKHKGLAQAISYGAGGVTAAIGLYGAGQLLTGGLAGMRVLRGLGGVGGLAGGIAKGKAVEAASGVTPVFVTNWPGHATARAAGEIGTGAALAEGAAGGGALTAAGVVLAPIAVTAIAAAASQKIGQHLAERDAKAMSTKELLALRGRQMVMGGGQGSYQVRLIDQQLALRRALDRPLTRPMRGEIVVKVRPERGTEAKTERPKSDNPAMTLQAETDVGMAAGGSW